MASFGENEFSLAVQGNNVNLFHYLRILLTRAERTYG
jgi:hypothetical protein